ncbi:MAG: ATP-binding protein [Actinomycetota bacterium]
MQYQARTTREPTRGRRGHALKRAWPRSISGRLVLALGVMLLPVVAVAVIDIVTFRTSLDALREFTSEGVEEARAIGKMREILVGVDDVGESYVETGDPASGKRFAATSERIEQEFDSFSRLVDTATERKLVSSARALWEDASEAVANAASAPPDVLERELDRFHDSLDEAISVTADLYAANVDQVAGKISSLRSRELAQLVTGLVVLSLSSIAAFVIARRLRRSINTPLLLLEEAATRLGSDNLSHRIPVRGEDELAHVGQAFNTMAERLQHSREEQSRIAERIEGLNADLERRVAARTRDLEEAMRELERAKQTAEEANRVKSEFLSRTSHELRTPLNAILGFGQLLQPSALSSEDRQSVDHILKGGRHLLSLINDVLDISRFDEGKTSFSLESVPLHDIVSESVGLIRPQVNARDLRLEVEEIDPAWFVHGDVQRLRQVLGNLLSNAVKFNRPGGAIRVSAFHSDGTYVVRVADTGPGIPPEQVDRLFLPFDRLGAERTDIEGTGLGLALSKALVEGMGGHIRVESEEGGGAAFLVELRESGDPAASSKEHVDPGTSTEEDVLGTVLCVEDNPSNLDLIEKLFRLRPRVVLLTAREGTRGLDLARERQPSLVLLDLHLPDLPGEEILHLLREDARTRDIPVVVTSADATPGSISRLRAQGANDYLTKPLKVAEVLAVVDEYLGGPNAGSSRERAEAS